MKTFIALLRGINVSGHKMIKMEDLRKMCASLKFVNARTYIQSGNIVFQVKQATVSDLEKKISKGIKKDFGFEVPVLVLELLELKKVLKGNPFVNKRKEDISRLHVTFLGDEPGKENLLKIKDGNYGEDEFIVAGKIIYLFCPNSYGNSKLNNNFFENKLKTTATTRNWKTLNELVKMAEIADL